MQSKTKKSSLIFPPIALLASMAIYACGWLHGQYMNRRWPFVYDRADVVAIDEHAGHAHDHAGYDHSSDTPASGHAVDAGHADHSESLSLELSETALKNLGLTEEFLQPIELRSYQQTISVPAIVVDRPGRTRMPVSASMTGIVTHVHAVAGEAVQPGEMMLEMRLTHEDLVTAQKEFLQSIGDREIENKEIARIESVVSSGAISPKVLLERQYNRDKLDSLLRSLRESLRLHGLSETQISDIENEHRLLTEMQIYAPSPDEHSEDETHLSKLSLPSSRNTKSPSVRFPNLESGATPFQVASQEKPASHSHEKNDSQEKQLLVLQSLHVQKGQSVNAGDLLCTLADYSDLLIEGQAFEAEAGLIAKAKLAGWSIAAVAESGDGTESIENLTLGWVNNEIDPATRTLKFFVPLKNVLLDDSQNSDNQRHVSWKYRIGQRMQLKVPVAQFSDQIVLPIDAVVREGIESFVFQQNGDRFLRVAVHEKRRDQTHVVVENDGSLFPGDVVALKSAHQMQMALKSKSGGGVDPHAGHNH